MCAAYFPWVGALHTLLDSLVDRQEDAAAGQRSLLDYYSSPQEAAARLGLLAAESRKRIRTLPSSRQHMLLLAGMASHYLSTPEAARPDALLTARSVLKTIGGLAAPTMLVMVARRATAQSAHDRLEFAAAGATPVVTPASANSGCDLLWMAFKTGTPGCAPGTRRRSKLLATRPFLLRLSSRRPVGHNDSSIG